MAAPSPDAAALDRKQRVEAACRVGAAFALRRFLRRWRRLAASSRALEQAGGAQELELELEERDAGAPAGDQELLRAALRCWRQRTAAGRLADRRLLLRAWAVWRQEAREGARKELLRRRAARFAYHQALRRGLRRLLVLVEVKQADRAAAAFAAWTAYWRDGQGQRTRYEVSSSHHHKKLLHKVLVRGFGANVAEGRAKRLAVDRADAGNHQRMLRIGLSRLLKFRKSEMHRDRCLENLLEAWQTCEATSTRRDALIRGLFTRWADHVRSKHGQQLVVANFRGRSYLRTLSACFNSWVSHLSALRWKQLITERARTHRRRSLLRKAFSSWRNRADALKEARSKTKAALIHWKLSLERRTFARWLAYIHLKHEKRQRLHDALQFRHTQLVTHGVCQWLTAALHLQNEREECVTRIAAAQTARVWRRVALIARHWMILAARKRRERLSKDECGARTELSRRALPYDFNAVDWLERPVRSRLEPVDPADRISRQSLQPNMAATLSPFVMLPRDRPQPRKPVELLLSKHLSEDSQVPADQIMGQTHRTNDSGGKPREVARYGFRFPDTSTHKAQEGKRLSPTHNAHQKTKDTVGPTLLQSKGDNSYTELLDALEQQLLRLETRKREWRLFQQRLNDMRASCSSDVGGEQIETRVSNMEREYQERYKDWSDAQKRLRDVAAELERLHEDMQLLKVSS